MPSCQLMKLNDVERGTQLVKESDRDNKKVIFSQKDESSSDEDTPVLMIQAKCV